ncbi:MAG: HEAT repeat domain-containing protein [Candidatus Brocadiia bacterium]
MPVWGDREITWRQIVPPVLIAVALVCIGLTLRGCLRRGQRHLGVDTQYDFYVAQLDAPNPAAVATAVRELGKLGKPEAIPLIRPKLDSEHPEVRGAACAALGRLGDEDSLATLRERLGDAHPAVRAGAAEGLAAAADERALPALLDMLGDPEPRVRHAVVQALGEIGDPRALEPLKALQEDPTAGLSSQEAQRWESRIQAAIDQAVEKLQAAQ